MSTHASPRRFEGRVGGYWYAIVALANIIMTIGFVLGMLHPESMHPKGWLGYLIMGLVWVGMDALFVSMMLPARNYVEVSDERVRSVCGPFSSSILLDDITGMEIVSGVIRRGGAVFDLALSSEALRIKAKSRMTDVVVSPKDPAACKREIEKRRAKQA